MGIGNSQDSEIKAPMKRIKFIFLVLLIACASSNTVPITTTVLSSLTPVVTITPDPNNFVDGKGVSMRLVPAGEFTMGSDADDALAECQKYRTDCTRDWFLDEEPPHQVYLDAYYMDIYEVTNAFYKVCVDAHGCTSPEVTEPYNDAKYENYPVVYVDWNQADAYCEWRNASLPTEAQWEKAAGGTDGRTYPWGEGISCDQANYSGCKVFATEVGSYENGKSPYGMYDMANNVWEWINDWYDENYYASSPYSNPLGPDSGQDRVVRGGAWSSSEEDLRTSRRDWVSPGIVSGSFGFRCVRTLP